MVSLCDENTVQIPSHGLPYVRPLPWISCLDSLFLVHCAPAPQGLYVPGKHQPYSCFSLRSCCSLDLECVSFRSSYVRFFSLFSYHIKCRLFRETVETLSVICPTMEHLWLSPLELLGASCSLSLPVKTKSWAHDLNAANRSWPWVSNLKRVTHRGRGRF